MGLFDNFTKPLMAGVSFFFGTSAIFTPAQGDSVDCTVKVDHDVILQPSGFDAQVVEAGSTITAFCEEVGEPVEGSIFTVETVDYEVKRITDNDHTFITMAVVND